MSVLRGILTITLFLSVVLANGAWAFNLPGQDGGPVYRVTMFSPDKSQVLFYSDYVDKETIKSEWERAGINFKKGPCSSDMDEVSGKLELESLTQRLKNKTDKLGARDRALLENMPLCSGYILDMFILAKTVQGYELAGLDEIK